MRVMKMTMMTEVVCYKYLRGSVSIITEEGTVIPLSWGSWDLSKPSFDLAKYLRQLKVRVKQVLGGESFYTPITLFLEAEDYLRLTTCEYTKDVVERYRMSSNPDGHHPFIFRFMGVWIKVNSTEIVKH